MASKICGKRPQHPDELPASSQGILKRFFSGRLEHLIAQVESIGKRLAEVETAAAASHLQQEIKRCNTSIDQLLTELIDVTMEVKKDKEQADEKINDLAERVAQLEIQIYSQPPSSRSENAATPCSATPFPGILANVPHQPLSAFLPSSLLQGNPTFALAFPAPVQSLIAAEVPPPPQNPPPSNEDSQSK